MCGRYAATLPPAAMVEIFRVLNQLDFPPRYNIAPTQPVVAIWEQGARRIAHLARWGLVPGWVKDPREFPLLINARAESMAEKPAFRDSVRNQRCVLPANGYYEWHTGPDKKKTPYYISMADGQPMALAGLYTTWMGPNGEEIDTVATVTTSANGDLEHIHDRMPVIIPLDRVDDWLNTREVDTKQAMQLALPLPEGVVAFRRVSTKVNSARFDEPELIEAVTEAQVADELAPPKPAKKAKAGPAQMDLF
jgi:putative SOS response-associated peptidase YedK